MKLSRSYTHPCFAALLAMIAVGCGESSESGTRAQCLTYDNTFDAIQARIFDDAGCSSDACHGENDAGGLDLRAGESYASLFEVPSTNSALNRVEPGSANESFLYHKLAAATIPEQAMPIAGAAMPFGLDPLTEAQLEALRLWIVAGAPETGSVGDTTSQSSEKLSELLGACLPDAEPIAVTPLDPPDAKEGVQFVMPTFTLDAESEVEVCFASYYDLTDVVPEEFHDGEHFWFNGSQLRMDSQSHHLLITYSGLGPEYLEDPSFGQWTCKGGARAGEACDPLDVSGCGGGLCGSQIRNTVTCIGYGPPEGGSAFASGNPSLGGIGSTQDFNPPRDGAFVAFPLRGILYWDSHAFNLTTADHVMHAWANVAFTDDRRFERRTSTDVASVYLPAGTPPYTEETYCAEQVAPLGSSVIRMISHTHKRGRDFKVWLPDGSLAYESFNYADPLQLSIDPPLLMDDPDPAGRTMRFCATFNNGLNPDGTLNPETVTRASRMPPPAQCRPVACVEGKVGAPCDGADDNATCDTSSGAGNGMCDACAITQGVTTEDEMFVFQPEYLIPVEP